MKRTPVLGPSTKSRENRESGEFHESGGSRRSTVPGARLDSLTGIRWFATFGVFLSHVGILMPLPHTRGLFSLGESGVSLFFVLSGFVLAWNWSPADRPRAFYGRRFARIWPLLCVAVVLPTVFAATTKGGPAVTHLLLISAAAVLLVQAWVPGWILMGASPVTWSLSCEAFFYGLFPSAVRRLHALRGRTLLVLVCAAVAALWALRIAMWAAYPPTRHLTSLDGYSPAVFCFYSPVCRVPQFLVGMAVAVGVRRGMRRVPLRAAAAALLVPVAVLWLLRGQDFRSAVLFDAVDPSMTPFFALLVAALAQQDLTGGPSFLRGRPLVRLGQWSYAFYLFQFTVLLPLALAANPGRQVADFFTDPLAPKASYTGYAVLALVITLAVSALLYRFVEHPLERRLRHRLSPPSGSGHRDDPPPEPPRDPTPTPSPSPSPPPPPKGIA